MRRIGLVVILLTLGAFSLLATPYTDRAEIATAYISNPLNGFFHGEGLVWLDGDPTNAAAPLADNQAPSYLGAYLWTSAPILAAMNAQGINLEYGENAFDEVFIANFNDGRHIALAGGVEPWWNESTMMGTWLPDSMLMNDAMIPWRFDPAMAFAASANDIYLERVLWTTYFLTLAENVEYSPFIAKVLRGIRNNPTYYNSTNGALIYPPVGDHLYLTALWGLVLESYMRSFGDYPVVLRPGMTMEDLDWSDESGDAYDYVIDNWSDYMGTDISSFWSAYMGYRDRPMAPMAAFAGLVKWEWLPIIMFFAASGDITNAETFWVTHMDDGVLWRDDVRDYFRSGAIWLNPRGYYEPLHRYPGITCFYEMGCMEMYRATLDSPYVDRILEREDNYWNLPSLWTGDHWVHPPNSHGTPMFNGMHAWVAAHLPDLEIVGMESSLPSEGIAPYDYNANTGQDHIVTVFIANHGLVPVEGFHLTFDEVLPGGGLRNDRVLVPFIGPGDTVGVTYDVGGPGLAGDHDIVCDFVDIPHVAGYAINDNNLKINVQWPAELDMIYTGGDVVTAPNTPLIARSSTFNVEVQIDNTGGSAIRDVELEVVQSSPYGLSLDFGPPHPVWGYFNGVVNIPGGTVGSIYLPVTAPSGVGSDIGDDIRIEAHLIGATDENDRSFLDGSEITISDNVEFFDIQHWSNLTAVALTPTTGWINATNVEPVTVTFSNDAGDVGEADNIGAYAQTLELIASVVTGINGLDAPVAFSPAVPAGGIGSVTFNLANNGASENAMVDVHFVGNYRDGNNGVDMYSPNSPLDVTFPGALGIDILPPDVQPLAPIAGTNWPADDTLRMEGFDNLSGVAWVEIFVQNVAGTQYWNFTTGVWQGALYSVLLPYSAARDEWWAHLPNHPPGNCVVNIDAEDVAGNPMPTKKYPVGVIATAHIVEVFADLYRGGEEPVPPGSDYEYESDWNWTYLCSVMVFNQQGYNLNNVVISLYSTCPYTTVNDITGPTTIGPFGTIWYKFLVTEPGFTFKDSLYCYVTGGTDGLGGNFIGQYITDNDLRVWVEKPADLELVETWVEPSDINVWLGGAALVTQGQVFQYHARVRNNGEDAIDSFLVAGGQNPPMGTGISPLTAEKYYNIPEGGEVVIDYQVVPTNPGNNPEQIDQDLTADIDLVVFTANNHEPGYVTGLVTITDNIAPIGIQQIPDLVTVDFEVEDDNCPVPLYWINRTNTVQVDLILENPAATAAGGPPWDDRAAVDRLLSGPDYTAELELHEPVVWPSIPIIVDHIDGLDAIGVTDVVVQPENQTEFTWSLSWDGLPGISYEGPVRIIDNVKFGDQNYQAQMYPGTSPHRDSVETCCGFYLGVDVTRPEVDIIWPDYHMYADFPETLKVLAWDNVSGLDPESVQVQFENPDGDVFNGTGWSACDQWFTAHFDITFDPDTFWYSIPKPDIEGCYSYYAYAYDSAGNKSLTDQQDFLWDVTAPTSWVTYPSPGVYSYTGCNVWDRRIEVHAMDDVTAGYDCVSHVKNVYVAIHDTLSDMWWDPLYPGNWRTSATAYWLPMTCLTYPDVWEYTGFTDGGTSILEIYCYARDSVGNFWDPNDTLRYVATDEKEPNSVLTERNDIELPNTFLFSPTTWWNQMRNRVWGFATDSITRVDSVRYSIYDSLADAYWNGTVFVPGPEIWLEPDEYRYPGPWFTPDAPSHAPGVAVDFDDTLFWRADFTPPECGWYRVRSKSYDDICHEETTVDDQNTKRFIFDNSAPVMHPRYPSRGGVYFTSDWRDSIVVFVYDSCGEPLCGTSQVYLWITNSDGEYWGYIPILGWGWHSTPLYVQAVPKPGPAGDTLWYYYDPMMITTGGTYNIFARAWDCVNNVSLASWCFTITTCGNYITLETLEPDPYFVGDTFTLRAVAYLSPGEVDTSFSCELLLGSTMTPPSSWVFIDPGPYYTSRGTVEVRVRIDEPVLGIVGFADVTDCPSTCPYSRAVTEPIDVIEPIDEGIGGFVMDNPGDQGDALQLWHNRSVQDPDYGGVDLDTTVLKVDKYHYYRDMDPSPLPGDTNWAEILVYVDCGSDPDSVRIMFDNMGTFDYYDYSMIIEAEVQGLALTMFSDRIPLGGAEPVDNIAPESITDLAISLVGGDIRLDWSEAVLGYEGTPEIDPVNNIEYDIYRFTEPYSTTPTLLATGWPDPFYDDLTGAGDVTTPYYYMVKAKDTGGNESPDWSNRVGEVDYEIGIGWNGIGYPLLAPGADWPAQFNAHIGVGFDPIYAYANPAGGWEALLVGGTPFRTLVQGREDMMAYSTGFAGVVTWVGDVPAGPAPPYYNLAVTGGNGWNGIMVPIERTGLVMASDLYNELVGLGYDPVTVAHRVAGGGWESIVVTPGPVYNFDFAIYPGQVYLVWVNVGGPWRRDASLEPLEGSPEVHDVMEMPHCVAVPVFTDDKSEIEELSATASYGKESIPVSFDNGYLRIEVSDFEEIEEGMDIDVTVSANNGMFAGYAVVTVGDGPVDITEPIALEKVRPELPTEYALHNNVPNPFNPTTTIKFDLPENSVCQLSIYNISGRQIKTLVSSEVEAGYHRAVWDGTDNSGREVPAGVYFYTISAGDFKAQRRMMLVK